jgi:hypothetical protein
MTMMGLLILTSRLQVQRWNGYKSHDLTFDSFIHPLLSTLLLYHEPNQTNFDTPS